jgi:hypothetical protein
MGNDPPATARLRLRNLPLTARLVLSAFLVSVGCGYFAALVQLHFQHAESGRPLPSTEAVVHVFSGEQGMTVLETLISADESKPFGAGGTMKPAFFKKAAGKWDRHVQKKLAEMKEDAGEGKEIKLSDADKALHQDREAERLAMVSWIRAGAGQDTYAKQPLPADYFRNLGIEKPDERFFTKNDAGAWEADVSKIVDTRCARCHAPEKGGPPAEIDLTSWEGVKAYCQPTVSGGMSLTKLAQSTHVHLLGFAMLYGLTGLLFAFTTYPGLVRVLIAPLPLVAQVVDIACWWLARVDPQYAHVIVYTGGIVAVGLGLQIVLTLFNLYGKGGKALLVLLIIAAGLGTWQLKERVIDPHLQQETAGTSTGEK